MFINNFKAQMPFLRSRVALKGQGPQGHPTLSYFSKAMGICFMLKTIVQEDFKCLIYACSHSPAQRLSQSSWMMNMY